MKKSGDSHWSISELVGHVIHALHQVLEALGLDVSVTK